MNLLSSFSNRNTFPNCSPSCPDLFLLDTVCFLFLILLFFYPHYFRIQQGQLVLLVCILYWPLCLRLFFVLHASQLFFPPPSPNFVCCLDFVLPELPLFFFTPSTNLPVSFFSPPVISYYSLYPSCWICSCFQVRINIAAFFPPFPLNSKPFPILTLDYSLVFNILTLSTTILFLMANDTTIKQKVGSFSYLKSTQTISSSNFILRPHIKGFPKSIVTSTFISLLDLLPFSGMTTF